MGRLHNRSAGVRTGRVSGRGRGGAQAGPIQPVVPARYQFNGTSTPGRPETGGAERSESERAGGLRAYARARMIGAGRRWRTDCNRKLRPAPQRLEGSRRPELTVRRSPERSGASQKANDRLCLQICVSKLGQDERRWMKDKWTSPEILVSKIRPYVVEGDRYGR